MNDEARMVSPRKILLAVIITGAVIVASIGGVFQVASSAGVFSAEVRVNGYVEFSNADQIFLFVDGVKVKTNYMGDNYGSYYENSYDFYNVRVKANSEHTFQLVTSDSEESLIITEYTPFGESTYITINIIQQKTRVDIEGTFNVNSNGLTVYLYVDGDSIDNYYVTHQGDTYSFTAQVSQNEEHLFKVQALDFSSTYSNQTTVYIGTTIETITLDIP